jgi:hypothetical protein
MVEVEHDRMHRLMRPARHLLWICLLAAAPARTVAADGPEGNQPRFDAIVRVALVRADPGGYTGQLPDDPNRGTTSLAINLTIEPEHVRIGRGWEANLDIEANWQPLFTMVKAPSWSVARPAFIDGLSTTAGGRIGHATRSTETSVVGSVGASRLSSRSVVVSSPNETAFIARNDISDWAFAFGGGVDFRWYAHGVSAAHAAADTLTPLVHIYGGVKHDQRFRRDGDLADFNDPTGRVYFGFDVQPLRVRTGTHSIMTVGGGFLMEAALRTTDRLPSGYGVHVGATIDLAGMSRR